MQIQNVMREVRNYFPRYRIDGRWKASGGVLEGCDMLLTGDWVAMTGSDRWDGVYQVAEDGTLPGLADGVWYGTLWLLKPPEAFLTLCGEITAWCEKHPADDVTDERFGEYSVRRAVDAQGVPVGWQRVFAASLLPWRRMYSEVPLTC